MSATSKVQQAAELTKEQLQEAAVAAIKGWQGRSLTDSTLEQLTIDLIGQADDEDHGVNVTAYRDLMLELLAHAGDEFFNKLGTGYKIMTNMDLPTMFKRLYLFFHELDRNEGVKAALALEHIDHYNVDEDDLRHYAKWYSKLITDTCSESVTIKEGWTKEKDFYPQAAQS